MDQTLLGKCGFYCGSCPTYLQDRCSSCLQAHGPGDCFTRDCVLGKDLSFCGQCPQFPCGDILTRPKATVLDKDWLLWKQQEPRFDLHGYWQAVLDQDAAALPSFFTADAVIRWHNTKEQFTVPEFVRANCEYPGQWHGDLQRQEQHGTQLTTVCRVWDSERSFHVTSFFILHGGRIQSLDEYWGDDGPAPQWRRDLRLGCPIGLEFYPAQVSDAAAWGKLRQKVWAATYRGIYPDAMIDQFDFPWHLEKDLAKLKHPEFHVYFLRLQEKNIGYLSYRHGPDQVVLQSLYLLPEAQRRGIGRAALDHVRAYCRDHSLPAFRLQCNPWNQNAMDFYKAMGGTETGRDLNNEEMFMDTVWFEFSV